MISPSVTSAKFDWSAVRAAAKAIADSARMLVRRVRLVLRKLVRAITAVSAPVFARPAEYSQRLARRRRPVSHTCAPRSVPRARPARCRRGSRRHR